MGTWWTTAPGARTVGRGNDTSDLQLSPRFSQSEPSQIESEPQPMAGLFPLAACPPVHPGSAERTSMSRRLPRRAAHVIASHRLVAAVVVIVLAGGGAALYLTTRSAASAVAGATYRVVGASLGTVRASVLTPGTLEPADQDSLSFPVSGKVMSLRVAAGGLVAKGQILATIDSAVLKATLAEAQAQLANAQATLVSARDSSASAARSPRTPRRSRRRRNR